MSRPAFEIRRLGPTDLADMRALNAMFGEAFEEHGTYSDALPSDAYLLDLFDNRGFVALAAFEEGAPIGGLAGYEFRKFERERSEFYVYDLAVLKPHRRKGVATALIEALKPIAAARGAYVLIIQTEPENDPALTLYGKLGTREAVASFDIAVDPVRD